MARPFPGESARPHAPSASAPGLASAASFLAAIAACAPALAQDISQPSATTQGAPASDKEPSDDINLEKLSVTAPTPTPDGSAEAGYLVKNSAAAGPFYGDMPLQDAPYSITVVPGAMIQNMQVYDVQTSLKYVPGVQTGNNAQNSTGTSSYTLRGFNFAGNAGADGQTLDGLVGASQEEFAPVEDKERVEVLNGVNGFLYGINNVGGDINLVLKRPTKTPLYEVDFGDNTGGDFYVHGDFGGPVHIPGIEDGIFAYRLNLVEQNGDTAIVGQSVRRNLESAAVDARLSDNLLLQFNASNAYYLLQGNTPFYLLGKLTQFPTPANPAQVRAFPSLDHYDDTQMLGIAATWNINDIFTFRGRWNYNREHLSQAEVDYSSFVNAQGAITERNYGGGSPSTFFTNAEYAFVDAKFTLFGIENKITTGFSGYYYHSRRYDVSYTSTSPIYACNYYNQSNCGFVATYKSSPAIAYNTGNNYTRNFMLGDEIKFGDSLTLLAGGNNAGTGSHYFNNKGAITSEYISSALTPSVALIYKPLPWLSSYASYQQSLSAGSVVTNSGSTIYTNNGAILPPYVGTQYEAGAKATIDADLLATVSIFHIDQANIYTQVNSNGTLTEFEGGSQVSEGVEFGATGKIADGLTLFGGFDVINPRVENNPSSPWQNGQRPQDASKVTAKLYSEYTLPNIASAPWLFGLTLTGGASYIGPFAASLPSSYAAIATIPKLPGYLVGDLGFRYARQVYGHPATLRVTVTNVANTGYWSAYGLEGLPRAFLASMEFKW